MRDEYNAIVNAGFVLQLDCPDLAMTRHNRHIDKTLAEFRDICELHIQAINEATKDIPAESMRLHLCWGNYEGPHHMDVAMTDIIDIVLKGRPAGISFEGANPRHEHEWNVWRKVDATRARRHPGRDRLHEQLHRAPGARRAAHREIRRMRRQRERHRRHGLRLRHLRDVGRRRPPHRLGQAEDACRGREDCVRAALLAQTAVRFAGFIDKDGHAFLINVAQVAAVFESGRATRILLINGDEYYVNEPLAQVHAKFEEIPDSD